MCVCYDIQVLVLQQLGFRYRVQSLMAICVLNACLLVYLGAVHIPSLQHYLGQARDIVHGAIAPSEQTHVVINVHVQNTVSGHMYLMLYAWLIACRSLMWSLSALCMLLASFPYVTLLVCITWAICQDSSGE